MSLELSYTDDGNGPPLIILHGLFGSKRNWASIVKVLATRHRVFALDMRNHGESPWDDTMTYGAMADDVAAFIERIALGPCTVMGHSMGGKAAMALALTRPELIERLIVVDIAPTDSGGGLHAYTQAMAKVPLATCTQRKDVEVYLQEVVTNPGIRQFLLQNLNRESGKFEWRINLDALDSGMDHIVSFPSFTDTQAFANPTKFIAGGMSDYIQAHHMGEIQRLFPHATVATIPNAGHWAHAEQADAFLREVQSFMGAVAT